MSRPNYALLLRRAHEHLIASVAAIALTTLMLASVTARAQMHTQTHRSVTPSVTILVPTVTIEPVEG